MACPRRRATRKRLCSPRLSGASQPWRVFFFLAPSHSSHSSRRRYRTLIGESKDARNLRCAERPALAYDEPCPVSGCSILCVRVGPPPARRALGQRPRNPRLSLVSERNRCAGPCCSGRHRRPRAHRRSTLAGTGRGRMCLSRARTRRGCERSERTYPFGQPRPDTESGSR
jgi:hypothetical protein